MSSTVDMYAVWHSSHDFRPTFCLADHWDEVVHYFDEYICKERVTYVMPDGCFVGEDVTGCKHLYHRDYRYPLAITRAKRNGVWRPRVQYGSYAAVLVPVEEEV